MTIIIPWSKSKPIDNKNRLMSFAGSGKGCWGRTSEEVKRSIKDLRSSWSK